MELRPSAPAGGPLVLALVRDLLFGTRIQDALHGLGCQAEVSETLDPAAVARGPALIIVDFSAPQPLWEPLVRAGRAAGVPVLAFGPHVDVAGQQAARAAGATRVVAKSKLAADLPALVTELAAAPGPG